MLDKDCFGGNLISKWPHAGLVPSAYFCPRKQDALDDPVKIIPILASNNDIIPYDSFLWLFSKWQTCSDMTTAQARGRGRPMDAVITVRVHHVSRTRPWRHCTGNREGVWKSNNERDLIDKLRIFFHRLGFFLRKNLNKEFRFIKEKTVQTCCAPLVGVINDVGWFATEQLCQLVTS